VLALLPGQTPRQTSIASAFIGLRQPLEAILASSGITSDSAGQMIHSLQASIETMSPLAQAASNEPAPAVLGAQRPSLSVVSNKDTLDYDQADISSIRNLLVGSWVHLAVDGDKLHPAKLSWISPLSSRLMFVNRRGVRVLVASVEELAVLKKAGKLQVYDQDNLFDHALDSVIDKLKTHTN
jgi:hypothetical protein